MSQKPSLNPNNDPSFQVLSSHGMVSGETIAQWTTNWWTWAVTSSADPLLSDMVGQDMGGMYFINGAFADTSGTTTERGVGNPAAIHAGETVLIPILNNLAFGFNGRGPDPATGGKGAANQLLTDWKSSVTSLFLNIDGHAVNNLQSDLVNTSWFNFPTPQPGSLIDGYTGALGPDKSVGYWGVVTLGAGTHTIDFGGSYTQADGSVASVHIIDHVNVV
jgi:hypothetical protein